MSDVRIVHAPPASGLCRIISPAFDYVPIIKAEAAADLAGGVRGGSQWAATMRAAGVRATKHFDVPNGDLFYVTIAANIPADPYFSDAWEADFIEELIRVNMPKARAIQKAAIEGQHEKTKYRRRNEIEVYDDRNEQAEVQRVKRERKSGQERIDGLDAELNLITDDVALKAFWPIEIDPLP